MSRPRSTTIDDKDKAISPADAPSATTSAPSSKPFPTSASPEPKSRKEDKQSLQEPSNPQQHLDKHERRHFELPLIGNFVGASTSSGHHPLMAALSSMWRPIVHPTHPSEESFHLRIRLFNQTNFNLILGDAYHCGGEFYQCSPNKGHVTCPNESIALEVRAKSYPFWSGGCQGGLQLALADGEEQVTGFAMGWSAPPIGSYQAGFSANHDAKAGRHAARARGHDHSNVKILAAEHHGHREIFHLVATPGQNAAYQVIQMPPLGAVHISAGGDKIMSTAGAGEGEASLKEEVKGLGERLGEKMSGAKGGKEGVKAPGSSEAQEEERHQDEQKHTHRPSSRQSEANSSQSTQPQQQKHLYSSPQIIKQPVAPPIGLPQERLQLHQSTEELRQDPAAAEHETPAQKTSSSSDQTRDKVRRLRRGDKPQAATPASA